MRLIDSDVIIWNWRSQEAAATLLAAEPFAISAVTYMELVQGMRNARCDVRHCGRSRGVLNPAVNQTERKNVV
jgi:hypothetical protein